MKNRYEVVIVGAGPAGLFASYEFIKKGFKNILIIDKGNNCQTRKKDEVLWGIGGAGLYSDGKLNFTPRLGKTDLTEFLDLSLAEKLIDEVEEIFCQFGMDGETYPTNKALAEKYRQKTKQLGFDLQIIKQKHLGSDKLPGYIQRMEKFLKDNGVDIETNSEVIELIIKDKKIKGLQTKKRDVLAKNVLLAPGRSGNSWLSKEMEKAGATLEQKAIEVGVRVEVPAEVLKEICATIYDPTFYLHSSSFDDELRTFCTNPTGFVAEEKYTAIGKEFVCVNGHAYHDRQSSNANFALLDKVSLSEPVTDTIAYGESICKLAATIGAGKPILQRYTDFKRHRRSTWERLSKSYINPTLKNVTPGDIGMAFPYRIVTNLIEGLEKLNELLPGLAGDSTLLYAPEVKFFSVRPKVNKNLETEIKRLFVAGDGAGVSGNIVGAAATGIIAARGIIAQA